MSRKLFDFSIKEWQGSFPEKGKTRYILSVKTGIGAQQNHRKSIDREFDVFTESNEDNGYSRQVTVKTIALDFRSLESSTTRTLLTKLHALYNNLVIKVKFDGTILSIENYQQIKEQWEIMKSEIVHAHRGSSLRKFIRSIEDRMKTEQKMIVELSRHTNYGLLFSKIYGNYDSLNHTKRVVPVFGEKGIIHLEEEVKISELDENNVVLTINNDIKLSNVLTAYSGYYKINIKSGWIAEASIGITERYDGILYSSEFYLQEKT